MLSEFLYRLLGPILFIAGMTVLFSFNISIQDLQRVVKNDVITNNAEYTQISSDGSKKIFVKGTNYYYLDTDCIVSADSIRGMLLNGIDNQFIIDNSLVAASNGAVPKSKVVCLYSNDLGLVCTIYDLSPGSSVTKSGALYSKSGSVYPDIFEHLNGKYVVLSENDLTVYKRVGD